MKRFISKTAFFVLPFLILYIITFWFFTTKAGDLLRLGLIPYSDKKLFLEFISYMDGKHQQNSTSFENEIKFVKLSKSKVKTYKILTIGDSFSEQEESGYQNILAKDFSVLHIDRYISNNQIQKLVELCNGDFFDSHKIQYVILQGVERNLIENIKNIDYNAKIDINQIDSVIMNHRILQNKNEYNFFSRTTLRFPYSAFNYFTRKNYLSNDQVYNVELNTVELFNNNSSKLLFYFEDLNSTKQNNILENVVKLNRILNTISEKLIEKNIRLIFLPSPDKYDLYYDYILDKQNLIKPIFFDNFQKLNKEFIYINSKEILAKELNSKKDVYYFGDTHWSPIATDIVAHKIKEAIKTCE